MEVLIGFLGPIQSLQFSRVRVPYRGGSPALSPDGRSLQRWWRRNSEARSCLRYSLQLYCSFHDSDSLVWHWRLYIHPNDNADPFGPFISLWQIQKCQIIQKLIFIIFFQESKLLLKYQNSIMGWDNLANRNCHSKKKISCLPCPSQTERIWD